MKVVVLKLDYHDEKCQKKVMKTVSGHSGVVSINLDKKDKKLTVSGDIDPVSLVRKLRKLCNTDILSVGAPKAPEKKDEKKDEPKKEDPKKDKKDENLAKLVYDPYDYYKYHQQVPQHYYVRTVEEDPNSCVIC